jgi:hypothetical protein
MVCLSAAARNGAPQLTVGVTLTPPIDRLRAVQHLNWAWGWVGRPDLGPWPVLGR